VYDLQDALVVSGFLHLFIRHADAVKIANIAQIVNVIAPVMTRGDEMFRQTIYYPFEMFSRRREGVSLRLAVEGPGYDSPSYGKARFVDASAIWNEGHLHLFLTNRSLCENAELVVDLADGRLKAVESGRRSISPGR
jgi:alpha-N-arabinofuranosidase